MGVVGGYMYVRMGVCCMHRRARDDETDYGRLDANFDAVIMSCECSDNELPMFCRNVDSFPFRKIYVTPRISYF